MEIKVEKKFKHDGTEYSPGETVDLPDNLAEDVVSKGYGKKNNDHGEIEPIEDSETPEFSRGSDKSKKSGKDPDMKMPVKTAGAGWIEIAVWFGDPHADEDYKKSTKMKIARKYIDKEENVKTRARKCPNCDENVPMGIKLTPNQALNLSSYLEQVGYEAKKEDRKRKKEGPS